jgi:hypothetical protein
MIQERFGKKCKGQHLFAFEELFTAAQSLPEAITQPRAVSRYLLLNNRSTGVLLVSSASTGVFWHY